MMRCRFSESLRRPATAIAVVFLVALCVAGSSARGATPTIGVNVHGVSGQELDEIRAAGFRVVRLDLTWERIEKQKNEYDWGIYDQFVGDLSQRGIRPLLLLDYGNSIYMGGATTAGRAPGGLSHVGPTSQDEIDGYARWAAAAAKHFEPVKPIMELWNEPDMDGTWMPQPDPAAYARLSLSACQHIRAAVPNAYVIGPAAAHMPRPSGQSSPFLDQFLASGAATCFSAISVHPYPGYQELGWIPAFWTLVRAKLRSHNLGDKDLVRSESGLSLYAKHGLSGPVTTTQQAIYAVEMFAQDAANGIPISVWYDWRDDGRDTTNAEDGFGLTAVDGNPKPAYVAVKTYSQLTSGASVVCQAGGLHGQKTLILFRDQAGHLLLMAWAPAVGPQTSINLGGMSISSGTDMLGKPLRLPSKQGPIVLGPTPIYIHLGPDNAVVRSLCRTS